jgi:hypothetical protein
MAITLKQIKAARDAPRMTDEETDARYRASIEAERVRRESAKGQPPHFDEDGYFVFSSGRRASCYGDVFGVSPDLREITYGCDGPVNWPPSDWLACRDKEADLTADDMRELADAMILRWTKFREGL